MDVRPRTGFFHVVCLLRGQAPELSVPTGIQNRCALRSDVHAPGFQQRLFYQYGDLSADQVEEEILVTEPAVPDEFLEGAVLVFPPAGVTEVFVEDQHRSGHHAPAEAVENGLRRRIGVAVDIDEPHRPFMRLDEARQRILEPAAMQRYILRNGRKTPLSGIGTRRHARPRFRNTIEGVKPVQGFRGQGSKKVDGVPVPHSELQYQALDTGAPKGVAKAVSSQGVQSGSATNVLARVVPAVDIIFVFRPRPVQSAKQLPRTRVVARSEER